SRQSLHRFFGWSNLHTLHFPQKEIRSGIVGSEIGRAHQTLRRLIVGTASVPGYSERDQHPHGLWKQAIALCENLDGRFQRAMNQKLGSPIEQVRFAGVKFRRALILPNRLQWIAELLLDIAQQVMKLGPILMRLGRMRLVLTNEQGARLRARTLGIPGAGISERQLVGIIVIAGVEAG